MSEQDIPNQRELARRLDMNEGQLSRLLKVGRMSWETLDRFCDALQCQPGDILVHVPD